MLSINETISVQGIVLAEDDSPDGNQPRRQEGSQKFRRLDEKPQIRESDELAEDALAMAAELEEKPVHLHLKAKPRRNWWLSWRIPGGESDGFIMFLLSLAHFYSYTLSGLAYGYVGLLGALLVNANAFSEVCVRDETLPCANQVLAATYLLSGAAVLTPICGALANRIFKPWGPRLGGSVGALMYIAALVCHAYAPDVSSLLYIPGFLGMALGGPCIVSAFSSVLNMLQPSAVQTQRTILSAGLVFSICVLPALGYLISNVGIPWKIAFLTYTAVPVSCLIFIIILFPDWPWGSSYDVDEEPRESSEVPGAGISLPGYMSYESHATTAVNNVILVSRAWARKNRVTVPKVDPDSRAESQTVPPVSESTQEAATPPQAVLDISTGDTPAEKQPKGFGFWTSASRLGTGLTEPLLPAQVAQEKDAVVGQAGTGSAEAASFAQQASAEEGYRLPFSGLQTGALGETDGDEVDQKPLYRPARSAKPYGTPGAPPVSHDSSTIEESVIDVPADAQTPELALSAQSDKGLLGRPDRGSWICSTWLWQFGDALVLCFASLWSCITCCCTRAGSIHSAPSSNVADGATLPLLGSYTDNIPTAVTLAGDGGATASASSAGVLLPPLSRVIDDRIMEVPTLPSSAGTSHPHPIVGDRANLIGQEQSQADIDDPSSPTFWDMRFITAPSRTESEAVAAGLLARGTSPAVVQGEGSHETKSSSSAVQASQQLLPGAKEDEELSIWDLGGFPEEELTFQDPGRPYQGLFLKSCWTESSGPDWSAVKDAVPRLPIRLAVIDCSGVYESEDGTTLGWLWQATDFREFLEFLDEHNRLDNYTVVVFCRPGREVVNLMTAVEELDDGTHIEWGHYEEEKEYEGLGMQKGNRLTYGAGNSVCAVLVAKGAASGELPLLERFRENLGGARERSLEFHRSLLAWPPLKYSLVGMEGGLVSQRPKRYDAMKQLVRDFASGGGWVLDAFSGGVLTLAALHHNCPVVAMVQSESQTEFLRRFVGARVNGGRRQLAWLTQQLHETLREEEEEVGEAVVEAQTQSEANVDLEKEGHAKPESPEPLQVAKGAAMPVKAHMPPVGSELNGRVVSSSESPLESLEKADPVPYGDSTPEGKFSDDVDTEPMSTSMSSASSSEKNSTALAVASPVDGGETQTELSSEESAAQLHNFEANEADKTSSQIEEPEALSGAETDNV